MKTSNCIRIAWIVGLFLSGTGESFAQTARVLSGYARFHQHTTLYDRTIKNNERGVGVGFELLWNVSPHLKPKIEANSMIFAGKKVLYLNPRGEIIDGKEFVSNLLIGGVYQPNKILYAGVLAGPSFLLAKRYLTIKPSVGVFFTQKQKVYLQMALTNVYQRDAISNQNFGYLNVEMGIQLF
ncbi:MAG: hypothetical protein EAZ32_00735 [Cytophagia bacterium]|nr:MAG: hypothetical protein EAZ46_13140 [Runella sp.]TAG23540.1 MAG: hypothetical protein EAZ38_03205 [Cytophagales bacterium]TAG42733.1 MAG: hypothetical protein EAZ32_00735 [Cytophagia bacterium]TAG65764.1 MAG: hypothetical protein EAZ26_10175 [Runella slithyformis]TAG76844.1 MAG: hypothetical protein EAZ22_16960 [Cytophagales bacterium]